jgi:16S rRNA (adenine1518-N6/adenine1519-N6)-dimethyltransferase
MTLSEMKHRLDAANLRLTKALGQNFLHDAHQLQRIVSLADVQSSDNVLEIGPGLGPLTQQLLARAAQVLALEKDQRLADLLRETFAGVPNLTLLPEDALKFLREQARVWSDWKLVANLPYSVASPILVELALADAPPTSVTVTLQLEVARRLLSRASSPDYGVLTLLVGQRYAPGRWFRIPSGCFFPEPAVDSACLRLDLRSPALLAPDERPTFVRLVKRAFSQRRKMMFKLLKQDWPSHRLSEAFHATGIPETARAEAVGLEGFVSLAKYLHTAAAPP